MQSATPRWTALPLRWCASPGRMGCIVEPVDPVRHNALGVMCTSLTATNARGGSDAWTRMRMANIGPGPRPHGSTPERSASRSNAPPVFRWNRGKSSPTSADVVVHVYASHTWCRPIEPCTWEGITVRADARMVAEAILSHQSRCGAEGTPDASATSAVAGMIASGWGVTVSGTPHGNDRLSMRWRSQKVSLP
jgi:hypothetical protein